MGADAPKDALDVCDGDVGLVCDVFEAVAATVLIFGRGGATGRSGTEGGAAVCVCVSLALVGAAWVDADTSS